MSCKKTIEQAQARKGREAKGTTGKMGEGKKEALQRFKDDSVTLDECPAKLVLGIKEHYVITDNNI